MKHLAQRPMAFLWLGLTLLLGLSLSATGLLAAAAAQDQDEDATANATIRFVHGVTGGPELDVLVDGQLLAEAVPYGAATDYVPIAPGTRILQVVPTGQPPEAALIEQELEADQARSYIFIAMGRLNGIEGRAFEVDLAEMTPGTARARLIQAAPDTGNLDVVVTGGDALFADIAFGAASGYVEMAPGSYTFDMRGEGDRTLGTIDNVTLEASRAYDLVAIGQLADETLTILALETTVDLTCAEALGLSGTNEDACVRLTHAAPDSAEVDAYVNDSLIAGGMAFGAATDFVVIPAGEDRVFKFTAAGAPLEEAILEWPMTLDPGQAYELLLTGNPDNLEMTITGVDLRPVPEGQARVGVIHASTDAGSLDLGFADSPLLFEGIEFRGVSEYVAVDEGSYELQVHPAEDQMVSLATDLDVVAGTVYDIVAVGRNDDQSLALLVLTAPVPLVEGVTGTPETNVSITPVGAGDVSPVGTLDPAEEAGAETVVVATPSS